MPEVLEQKQVADLSKLPPASRSVTSNERPAKTHSFIHLDYLDTENLRHIDYGALKLRKEVHLYLAKGVLIASSIALLMIFSYVSWKFIKSHLEGDEEEAAQVVVTRTVSIVDLPPPPPIDEKAPPPPPPAAFKPPQSPDVGEIKRVRDEEAPPTRTIATQEKLKEMIEKGVVTGDDTTGLSEARGYVASALGRGEQLVLEHKEKEEDPDPDVFVALEKEPQFVNQVKPVYPEIARKGGIEGRVVVRVLIDRDGKPKKAQIVKNPGIDVFDEAAIDAVMQSTYSPAIQNGRPVKCWMTIPINFRLTGPEK
ncbi:MAG: energy transducer TonB [Chloroherpetonaceae bacterium]|nr:energy transducer TonB [Chloroherpetonaceae bacterium]MDW8020796.1 energy transducer TonB [Chloroherpetonaceae bacterium]